MNPSLMSSVCILEYAAWCLAHTECKKYLRLIKYLNEETIMEQSPTLQRSIREHRSVIYSFVNIITPLFTFLLAVSLIDLLFLMYPELVCEGCCQETD